MARTKSRQLTPNEQAILAELKTGPKSVREIANKFGKDYTIIYRPMMNLERSGWVEIDTEGSAFNTEGKLYRIARTPNDGIEILVNVGGSQQAVSFNSLVETMSKQDSLPKIATEWPTLPYSLAMLAYHATRELDETGSVTDAELLEIKSKLHKYRDVLLDQYGLVQQVLEDNRFWEPTFLKQGTLIKTDRPLSINEMREVVRTIIGKFVVTEEKENEDE